MNGTQNKASKNACTAKPTMLLSSLPGEMARVLRRLKVLPGRLGLTQLAFGLRTARNDRPEFIYHRKASRLHIGLDSFQAVMRPQEYGALWHARFFICSCDVNMASFHHSKGMCVRVDWISITGAKC